MGIDTGENRDKSLLSGVNYGFVNNILCYAIKRVSNIVLFVGFLMVSLVVGTHKRPYDKDYAPPRRNVKLLTFVDWICRKIHLCKNRDLQPSYRGCDINTKCIIFEKINDSDGKISSKN